MENIIYIKQLLERFYNGQTTLDEENDLKMFFSDCQNIPKELEADKTLFNIIKSTDISILTLSRRLGFSDQFYFSRRFKEIFGKSPREYRKNQLL